MIQKFNNTIMMKIKIDPRSEIPIYLQIVEQVSDQISLGTLNPGDQLPTVRLVAQDLRINFNTVSRAYRILDEAGIISTQQGRGTYILEKVSADSAELIRAELIDDIVETYISKTAKLGLSTNEAIDLIKNHLKRKYEREIK
jgi:GntR family transcriptional regulator